MGARTEREHYSRSHEETVREYREKVRRRAKAFVDTNRLAQLLGIDNENDAKKRALYLRLIRGNVIQGFLGIEANGKHPAVVDHALVAQRSINEDLEHSRLAPPSVLCGISLAVSNLFYLLRRSGVKVEKNKSPISKPIIKIWERSSLLPVIELPQAAVV